MLPFCKSPVFMLWFGNIEFVGSRLAFLVFVCLGLLAQTLYILVCQPRICLVRFASLELSA